MELIPFSTPVLELLAQAIAAQFTIVRAKTTNIVTYITDLKQKNYFFDHI